MAPSQVTFVSPRADAATQMVLIKSAIENKSGRLRSGQFVRARVIWSERQGPAVPVLAVQSRAGQAFVWVVAPAPDGRLSAQPRPVKMGPIQDQLYPDRRGLAAGRAHRGVGRAEVAAGRAGGARRGGGARRTPQPTRRSRAARGDIGRGQLLHRAAGLRLGVRDRDRAGRRRQHPHAADRAVPRARARRRCRCRASTSGASAQVVESAVTTPLEQQINGAEGMRYMQSTSGSDGTSVITVTFDVGPRQGSRRGRRAEPRQHRAAAPARRGEEHRASRSPRPRPPSSSRPASTRRTDRSSNVFISNYIDRLRARRAQAHSRRRRRARVRRAQVRDAAVAGSGAPGVARA